MSAAIRLELELRCPEGAALPGRSQLGSVLMGRANRSHTCFQSNPTSSGRQPRPHQRAARSLSRIDWRLALLLEGQTAI